MLGLRRAGAAALAAALLVPSVAAKLSIKSAKVTVTGSTGADKTIDVKDGSWGAPITLEDAATFKLGLNIVDGSAGVLPQQAFIQFRDDDGVADDVTLALTVKSTGKASYNLDTARPPAALKASSGHLTAVLLLSNEGESYRSTLGKLVLPSLSLDAPWAGRYAVPPAEGFPAFAPMPEITHTFQAAAKPVASVKAIMGSLAVLAPWITLCGLVGTVWPALNIQTPPSMMYAWFVCLTALEALILRYWIGLRLYQLLPPFIVLAAITAYVGTVALRATRTQRLKAGGI